jgi:arginase
MDDNLGSMIQQVLQPFIPTSETKVYVSFDMDCIDPVSFSVSVFRLVFSLLNKLFNSQGMAPGVSHRESGGLTVRQAIDAIHAIPGRLVGADLVEFNPSRDIQNLTASVAAKLVKELTGQILRSNNIA